MPFIPADKWKDAILSLDLEGNSDNVKRLVKDARGDLERAYEGLRALLGTSLSSIALVSCRRSLRIASG